MNTVFIWDRKPHCISLVYVWGSVCIQGSTATQEACFQLAKEANCKMP